MIDKIVIIINGNGGCGKDTLCNLAAIKYKVRTISSITPIKEIASQNGWDGEKDEKGRKLLADLKTAFTEYNDLSFNHMKEEYEAFKESDNRILFVHIREPEEIDRFKKYVDMKCITLLVIRNSETTKWNNLADDNVEDYYYDYIYDNDLPLEATEECFLLCLKRILEED